MKRSKGLTAREKLFCSCYVNCGNYKEAAVLAGYSQPEKAVSFLTMRDDINEMIARIYRARAEDRREKARAGYERLAFGSISDAKIRKKEKRINQKMKKIRKKVKVKRGMKKKL